MGTISDIAFDLVDGPYDNALFYYFELYFCHTSLDELTENFSDNYDGNTPILVSEADPLNITLAEDGWFSFPDPVPFEYDGENNLIVELRWMEDNGSDVYNWGFDCGSYRVLATKFYDGDTGFLSTKMNRMRLVITLDTIVKPTSLGLLKTTFH